MSKKQELLDYIMSLTPEQVDKVAQRLDLLKKVVNMSEPEAIYTNTLTGKPVTREQFHRIFKLYKEYEDIIKKNNMTNGEVDIAIRIIKESYEKHMRHHSFVEDIRGYDI